MLSTLSIKNYALIDQLNVKFNDGLSIITGETGAGKSILLGALGLVLGKRADVSYLKDTTQKCIVEAEFNIQNYSLESFFSEEDLDFEQLTIIRREILPSGKSRAFINDTPTTLSVLNSLSEKLIDVHSQHQTLALSDTAYQFKIIDALASNESKIASYKRGLAIYNQHKKELVEMLDVQQEEKQHYEYNLYLYNELETAGLTIGEQEKIEQELELLNNVEEIKLNLTEALEISENEEVGIASLISLFKSKLNKIAGYSEVYNSLSERVESLDIELKDVIQEIEDANENVSYNPSEIEKLNDRLQLIYDLLKKHSAANIDELLQVYESLSEKVYQVENSSKVITDKRQDIEKVSIELNKLALSIHKKREKVIPVFIKKMESNLSNLGMENSRFQLNLTRSDTFFTNGKDELKLLFSANKGGNFGELKKVASGGELSRIMLAVKSILSEYINLPTIIFDEIDTGVSGEISNKMGDIMSQMSTNMQVISITHLPQIAAKGKQHYKVYKEEISNVISTQLKLLSSSERVNEIAEMLGGKNLTDSALTHAKELLN
ncbi:DNA repair protein RecN [Urechidicola croceus]|uniref:DNA repair protein RecN n=1 Tax=Urechidicola croceus TaxID=1850246 RepID=A0A1D8P3T0_9FLAO|nr:DNA repair protein RecN [Urechidicola croceus]AOW19191.1 DNA repair protein RecN [Urechidicola croceus]